MHQQQFSLYPNNNYSTSTNSRTLSNSLSSGNQARNHHIVSNHMYSIPSSSSSQVNTNAQFNEAFYFNNNNSSTPSSTSSSSSISSSSTSNQDTNITSNYDYFNHHQASQNDSDVFINDLEYLLSNSNSTANNQSLNAASVRNLAKNTNFHLQRPPPLSTPAIHHQSSLNSIIFSHNLLLDDDQTNPSTLDNIILPDNNHQTYYSIDQIETQRFPNNDLLSINEPVHQIHQQQQQLQAQQFNQIQPIEILETKPKVKSTNNNKKRNVKDILNWPATQQLLTPKLEEDTPNYHTQTNRKKLKQNDSFDEEKQKRSDEFKCWVCGDKSSGNHYGALTCEACKLFFRRHSTLSLTTSTNEATKSDSSSSTSSTTTSSSEPKIMQQCSKRNCQITPNTRGTCPECRYRKCIAVGMGLNRTTFGRHTTNQKLRYNSRVTDLFSEIMKLFINLKSHLDIITLKMKSQQQFYLSGLYLIPLTSNNTSLNHMNVIENKCEFEELLMKFYNDVIELMIPNTTKIESSTPSDHYFSKTKLTNNILVAFCIIFGYNLKLNSTSSNTKPINLNQLQHICKQMKDIDIEFKSVPQRIKIIYFLLIMFNSFSVNALDEPDHVGISPSHSNKLISNYLQSTHSSSTNMLASSLTNRLYDDYVDDCFNIQRSLIDLLNSELYFQQNNLSSTRVSLLLKIDQFI